jgi:hypothetical protein
MNMRTYTLFCFLLITQCLLAQSDSKLKDSFFMEPTAVGVPDGEMNSSSMDASGGKVVSADGRVELVFPPGALTKKSTITIQPVTNVTSDNVGKGYDFGPTGLHFEKPVQLVFHYSDSDMKDGTPQLMGGCHAKRKRHLVYAPTSKIRHSFKNHYRQYHAFLYVVFGLEFYARAKKNKGQGIEQGRHRCHATTN